MGTHLRDEPAFLVYLLVFYQNFDRKGKHRRPKVPSSFAVIFGGLWGKLLKSDGMCMCT